MSALHSDSRNMLCDAQHTTSPIPLQDIPLHSVSQSSMPGNRPTEQLSTNGRGPVRVIVLPEVAAPLTGCNRADALPSIIRTDTEQASYLTARTIRRDTDINGEGISTVKIGPSIASSGPNGAWTTCVKALREHDQHLVQGWKEDVDSLLIFAGLFSAVVTPFNIESYKFLQEDPEETSAALLGRILAQLGTQSGTSPQPSFMNSSNSFSPTSRSIRINILWFSSLVLSLVSASVGILTKQWLREYTRNAASSPRENARIRQLRHEEFVRWKIPLTIALLPVLLQISLALFFAGLLDLLWGLHASVASVITATVTVSLAFLVLTTIMPTFRSDCPYKSPQAFGVYFLMQGLTKVLSLAASSLYTLLGWDRLKWPLAIDPAMFRPWRRRLAASLLNLKHRRFFNSWREREMATVHDPEVATQLDRRVLAEADATFMEDEFLYTTIGLCLRDTECPAAVECLYEIVVHRADTVLAGIPHWRHRETVDPGVSLLLKLILDVMPRMDRGDSASAEKMMILVDGLCRAIPFEVEHYETKLLYQRLFEVLARFLTHDERVKMHAFGIMQRMWARSNAHIAPAVMRRLISFARTAKQGRDYNSFHAACEITLAFVTTDTMLAGEFDGIKPELRHMLADLAGYLLAPSAEIGQSASILLALSDLNELDPDLIVSAGLRALLDSVVLRRPARANSEDVSSSRRRRLEYARDLRDYFERFPGAKMGRRRTTAMSGSKPDVHPSQPARSHSHATATPIHEAPFSPLETAASTDATTLTHAPRGSLELLPGIDLSCVSTPTDPWLSGTSTLDIARDEGRLGPPDVPCSTGYDHSAQPDARQLDASEIVGLGTVHESPLSIYQSLDLNNLHQSSLVNE
ncbi:hypothetical protein C2E23DRAFT_828079 [Lenzites betulinus]|nr:hypothetical protein C2E23DRAFT_828079 [Lenzites betulinus]